MPFKGKVINAYTAEFAYSACAHTQTPTAIVAGLRRFIITLSTIDISTHTHTHTYKRSARHWRHERFAVITIVVPCAPSRNTAHETQVIGGRWNHSNQLQLLISSTDPASDFCVAINGPTVQKTKILIGFQPATTSVRVASTHMPTVCVCASTFIHHVRPNRSGHRHVAPSMRRQMAPNMTRIDREHFHRR